MTFLVVVRALMRHPRAPVREMISLRKITFLFSQDDFFVHWPIDIMYIRIILSMMYFFAP